MQVKSGWQSTEIEGDGRAFRDVRMGRKAVVIVHTLW